MNSNEWEIRKKQLELLEENSKWLRGKIDQSGMFDKNFQEAFDNLNHAIANVTNQNESENNSQDVKK